MKIDQFIPPSFFNWGSLSYPHRTHYYPQSNFTSYLQMNVYGPTNGHAAPPTFEAPPWIYFLVYVLHVRVDGGNTAMC